MEPLKAVQHSRRPTECPKDFFPYLRWCKADQALLAAYRMHAQLRDDYPMARRISRPGIPAPLSESLVAAAAPHIFGSAASISYGGTAADLIVDAGGASPAYVEVKATGSGEFQEIKARDLAADVLVWVAFGRRYELGHGPIDVFVLTRPQRFRPALDASGQPRRKLMLNKFLEQARVLDGFSALVFL